MTAFSWPDRGRLRQALERETARFVETHPRSRAHFERARRSLLAGVPMPWMVRWPGGFPVVVAEGSGGRFRDVDGHDYVDFCLGDTGAMTGHAPPAVADAVADRMRRGATFMLPVEDAVVVAEELQRRFGLPSWQYAVSATDANRFAIRIARHLTARPKVLVFNWCYHGTVDEAFITIGDDGLSAARPGNIGPPVDPAVTTRVVEFNDVDALERELEHGDVACVLAEPAMTNIGIILPEPGFHAALRDLTRRTGTLLVLDETHTLSAGAGGCTGAWGLEPDMLTLGKAIAGGVPGAVYGLSADVAERIQARIKDDESDAGGIGGTLAGNALSIAAMRATLAAVLTPERFEETTRLAARWAEGVESVIRDRRLPWHVVTLGCRAEYWFRETPPKNGGEAAASVDADLDRYMHLAALNRGFLITPFHNMALIAPGTSPADVDRHTQAFRDSVEALL
ncbi:MAG TPA: aspartate aminotransferase family protein [Candidatus Polarisedimenticolia bacterium]|nr:aspartate aminotransferase family protein [Candidatus Polarisedimenticolia bacterium]